MCFSSNNPTITIETTTGVYAKMILEFDNGLDHPPKARFRYDTFNTDVSKYFTECTSVEQSIRQAVEVSESIELLLS